MTRFFVLFVILFAYSSSKTLQGSRPDTTDSPVEVEDHVGKVPEAVPEAVADSPPPAEVVAEEVVSKLIQQCLINSCILVDLGSLL